MTAKASITADLNQTRQRAIEELRGIVLDALGERDAAVYLFGSHARGHVRHASDIDIAILPREDLPPAFFAKLADTIVDLRGASPAFREEVIRTGINWRG